MTKCVTPARERRSEARVTKCVRTSSVSERLVCQSANVCVSTECVSSVCRCDQVCDNVLCVRTSCVSVRERVCVSTECVYSVCW